MFISEKFSSDTCQEKTVKMESAEKRTNICGKSSRGWLEKDPWESVISVYNV